MTTAHNKFLIEVEILIHTISALELPMYNRNFDLYLECSRIFNAY